LGIQLLFNSLFLGGFDTFFPSSNSFFLMNDWDYWERSFEATLTTHHQNGFYCWFVNDRFFWIYLDTDRSARYVYVTKALAQDIAAQGDWFHP